MHVEKPSQKKNERVARPIYITLLLNAQESNLSEEMTTQPNLFCCYLSFSHSCCRRVVDMYSEYGARVLKRFARSGLLIASSKKSPHRYHHFRDLRKPRGTCVPPFAYLTSLSLSLISVLCLLFDGGVGDKPLHFWVYSLLVVLKKEVVIGVLINASDIVTKDSSGTSLVSFCIHSFIHPVSPLFMVPPCGAEQDKSRRGYRRVTRSVLGGRDFFIKLNSNTRYTLKKKERAHSECGKPYQFHNESSAWGTEGNWIGRSSKGQDGSKKKKKIL